MNVNCHKFLSGNSLMILCMLIFIGCNKKVEKIGTEAPIDKNLEMFMIKKKIDRTITSEIIDKTSDTLLEQVIADNIQDWISKDYNNSLLRVKSLSKGQQMFWSTWILEGEVNNGGFNQFYVNCEEEFGQMAEVGFRLIGLQKYAALTDKANQTYKENKARLEKYNDGTVKSFSESYKNNPLNKLTDDYFDLQDEQGISASRIKYIREHKEEFVKKN